MPPLTEFILWLRRSVLLTISVRYPSSWMLTHWAPMKTLNVNLSQNLKRIYTDTSWRNNREQDVAAVLFWEVTWPRWAKCSLHARLIIHQQWGGSEMTLTHTCMHIDTNKHHNRGTWKCHDTQIWTSVCVKVFSSLTCSDSSQLYV